MERIRPWRFPTWTARGRARNSALYLLIALTVALFGLFGCNRGGEEPGKHAITYRTDSLPNLILTDQYDHQLSLASLRGKPVLFDFIYTKLPWPLSAPHPAYEVDRRQVGRSPSRLRKNAGWS